MNALLKELNGKTYLEIGNSEVGISGEEYSLDLISLCASHNVDLLLFERESLPDEFYDLRTGFAGAVLQKFSNYRVKAAIITREDKLTGRFAELALEANRGKWFRIFSNRSEAEKWLTG
jgi:hypothetical protein